MASDQDHAVRTVTVPIDLSAAGDRAIPQAVRLARALGATVELVTLVAPRMPSIVEQAALEARAAELVDIECSVRVIESLSFGQTLAEWGAREGRLLCLTTLGRSALGKAFLGSVAADLAHAAMTPFVLIGPDVDVDTSAPFSTLIGCVDGNEAMDVMVDAIARFHVALGATVQLVTVDGPGPISYLPGARAFEPVDRAANALQGLGCHPYRRLLEEQDVAGGIASYVSTQAAPLLVVGTHQRGRVSRVAHSSGALEIVQRSPVPVLVVPFGRASQRWRATRHDQLAGSGT